MEIVHVGKEEIRSEKCVCGDSTRVCHGFVESTWVCRLEFSRVCLVTDNVCVCHGFVL